MANLFVLFFDVQIEHEHLLDWYIEGRGYRPTAFRYLRLMVRVILQRDLVKPNGMNVIVLWSLLFKQTTGWHVRQ